MKAQIVMLQLLSIVCIYMSYEVQSIYFYLEKGMTKCFKDEVVKNYVSKQNRLCFSPSIIL